MITRLRLKLRFSRIFLNSLGFDIDLPTLQGCTFDLDNAAWLGNVDWNI